MFPVLDLLRPALLGGAALAFGAAAALGFVQSRRVQLFGGLLRRAEVDAPAVALTFDDGPDPVHCAVLLATLKRYSLRATFFVVGSAAEREPALLERILADGHELGNHTYSHRRMLLVSPATIREEVERTDALIRRAGQRGPVHFRPPCAAKLFGLPRYLAQTRRRTVLWDVEPDCVHGRAPEPSEIVARTVTATRRGSIVLLHAMGRGNAATRAALPQIIERLLARGFRFVTVSELLSLSEAASGR